MTQDRKKPIDVPAADDDRRAEQAKRVIEDYTRALRAMLERLRRMLN